MRHLISIIRFIPNRAFLAVTALLLTSCSAEKPSAPEKVPAPVASTVQTPATPVVPKVSAIRIRAGSLQPFTNSLGQAWLADTGFADGDTIERPGLVIANTKDEGLYQVERYSMTRFTWPLPNGKYTIKLHFAETFEGITAAGERVFTFNVQGKEFKDFDVFAKAGGPQRAYIETVPVDISDGKLQITFTPQVENPQINGIEILPD